LGKSGIPLANVIETKPGVKMKKNFSYLILGILLIASTTYADPAQKEIRSSSMVGDYSVKGFWAYHGNTESVEGHHLSIRPLGPDYVSIKGDDIPDLVGKIKSDSRIDFVGYQKLSGSDKGRVTGHIEIHISQQQLPYGFSDDATEEEKSEAERNSIIQRKDLELTLTYKKEKDSSCQIHLWGKWEINPDLGDQTTPDENKQ
jgi:hypothetical protein